MWCCILQGGEAASSAAGEDEHPAGGAERRPDQTAARGAAEAAASRHAAETAPRGPGRHHHTRLHRHRLIISPQDTVWPHTGFYCVQVGWRCYYYTFTWWPCEKNTAGSAEDHYNR